MTSWRKNKSIHHLKLFHSDSFWTWRAALLNMERLNLNADLNADLKADLKANLNADLKTK